MAAPTTQQSGADFIITAGGTAIGGRRGGTLTVQTEALDASSVDTGYWSNNIAGIRSWQIGFDGLFLEGTTEIPGKSLAFKAAASGGTPVAVEAVDQVVITLDAQFEPVVNQVDAFERSIVIVGKSGQVSVNLAYIDPAGAGGTNQGVLWTKERAGEAIDWEVTLGTGLELSGTGMISTIPLAVPHRNSARMDGLTILQQGAIAQAGTLDGGLSAMLADFLATPPAGFAVVFKTATTGATQWSGNAFLTNLVITIPRNGMPTVSGTLTGTGAITRGTTA